MKWSAKHRWPETFGQTGSISGRDAFVDRPAVALARFVAETATFIFTLLLVAAAVVLFIIF